MGIKSMTEEQVKAEMDSILADTVRVREKVMDLDDDLEDIRDRFAVLAGVGGIPGYPKFPNSKFAIAFVQPMNGLNNVNGELLDLLRIIARDDALIDAAMHDRPAADDDDDEAEAVPA